MPAKKEQLTKKQERFCLELINPKTKSKAEAYRIAYPTSRKWKNKSIHNAVEKLLKHTGILRRVKLLQEKIESEKIAEIKEIAEGFTQDIRFDPRLLYNEDGNLKPINELPAEVALSLSGFKLKEQVLMGKEGKGEVLVRQIEYKFADKVKNRELLGKHLGMFEKDNEQKRPLEIAIVNYYPDEPVPKDVTNTIQLET